MSVEVACTLRARLRGLLGRSAMDGVLLIAPCKDIHTFGMGRSIDVAFLAADSTVMESHRGVPPNRRLRCKGAVATLERFAAEAPWPEPGERILCAARCGTAVSAERGEEDENMPDMPFEHVR